MSNEENPIMKGLPDNIPNIDYFDEEINKLFVIKSKIENYKAIKEIYWLKVQASPLKDTLSKTIQVWINKWTNYLSEHVAKMFQNIKTFSTMIEDGIKKNPNDEPENKDILYRVMDSIREMNRNYDFTKKQFLPMREKMTCLRKFGIESLGLTEKWDWFEEIDKLRDNWEITYSKIFDQREQILDLKRLEGENIKKKNKE